MKILWKQEMGKKGRVREEGNHECAKKHSRSENFRQREIGIIWEGLKRMSIIIGFGNQKAGGDLQNNLSILCV